MDFKKIALENGLRVILVPQPASLATTVMVLVQAGSKYETREINGLSHFLEHMCFKGTTKRPNQLIISSELDGLGAEYNAFTGQEYTGYFAKARNESFEKILDVIADMYLNPVFNPTDIDKERGPIIEEINMYEDLPMRRVQEFFMRLVYGDQPAGWDIAGSKENIRRLQQEDFLKYRAAHYVAKATIVIVAGGFKEEEVEEKIKNAFAGIKVGEKAPKIVVKEEQTKPEFLLSPKTTDQTHLVLGCRAFDIHDRRRFGLGILADLLGGGISSRLFQKIRSELSAAYYVNASADLFTDHGLFSIAAGVGNDKVEAAVKIALEEFANLKEELVPAEELKKVKEHMVGHLFLSVEGSDELASFYGGQEVVGSEILTPQALAGKIQAVTAEEIRETARFVFRPDRLNLALISPLKDKDFSSILKV